MKKITCTRTEFVNAMLTLRAPHPALYPYLSVFAALWDSSGDALMADSKALNLCTNQVTSPHRAGYIDFSFGGFNRAKFTLKINLPHAADGFHEAYFETDGVGHYEVRYCGDDLDRLFNTD